jgi:hypothetical protein
VIIRNGADVQHFSRVPASLSLEKTRPIVGYFGAISEWFDFKLLLAVAKMRPQWDFILIGSTFGCEHIPAVLPANVQLLGEKPYTELPGYLHAFDVCLVPFKVVELTRCTNPVKVYEYLSAGKPVVATALPEVLAMDGMVRTASSPDEFVAALDQAMLEREDAGLAERRQGWAVEHSWAHRVTRLDSEVSRLYPKVSVVVLTYNNLDLTKSCLESIERFGCYPNMELVIVDNASSDATAEFLRSYAENRPGVRVILNQHNLGFAAGNNVGLSAASGEYLIVLNNDTYVTPGWIEGILRHFRQQPELGLVGPVTNNIGNEARVDVRYPDMAGMLKAARHYTAKHARERLYVDNVAFFCAAMPRTVWEIVGPLEEAFGVGFFEDDDYCNRVRQAGFKIAIADDVFVHHHLSASFNKLGDEVKRQLFERNKRIYEKKWGPWKPHRYRQAANES